MRLFDARQRNDRSANIELLRLLSMAGVIILHYNNTNIGGGFAYVSNGSLNELVLHILESVNICAVNLFMMISGYFLSKKNNRSIGRGLSLIIQVIIFNIAFYIVGSMFHKGMFEIRTFILTILPCNYFVILYVTVYLISPLINKAIVNLQGTLKKGTNNSELDYNKIFLCILLLFSVWPTLVDVLIRLSGNELTGLSTIGMYGSDRGYTIINFILGYMSGAYIAIYKDTSHKSIIRWKTGYLICALLLCVGVLTVWGYADSYTAYEYCNPLIFFEAFIFLMLFLRLQIKSVNLSKVINTVSRCSFTVYLIHIPLIPYLNIEKYCNNNTAVLLLHIIVSVMIITAAGFFADLLYRSIFGVLLNKLKKIGNFNIS